MNATADLRSEHVAVLRMLHIMDALADHLRSGTPVPVEDLRHIVEFLRVFVDRCHHTKEEQLLFPAMHSLRIASAEQTIALLLMEHTQGREFVVRIAEATLDSIEAEELSVSELADTMTAYSQLLHAHIRREEEDCFDLADSMLPPAVQDELVEGYERIELEVVGQGRHEAFHALIDRLLRVYT